MNASMDDDVPACRPADGRVDHNTPVAERGATEQKEDDK